MRKLYTCVDSLCDMHVHRMCIIHALSATKFADCLCCVHACVEPSRATEMLLLQYRNKRTLVSHRPPHVGPLDRSACQFLSSW